NRGPQSLGMLHAVKQRVDSGRAVALLGNHDLHLLATDAGVRPLQDSDTVAEILAAPDRRELIDWLRAQPLAHREAGILFARGGVPPQWSADDALSRAAEVGQRLAKSDYC